MICRITNPSDKISSSEMNFRLSKMKMSVLKCTLCLLLVFALTGCGIAVRIKDGRSETDNKQPGYFTSTKSNIVFQKQALEYLPCLMPIALIDLPFSFAADIVCLPFEILMDKSTDAKRSSDKQFWETYFAKEASL